MITPAFRGHARSPRSNASDPEAQLERTSPIRSRSTSVQTPARSTVATLPSSIPTPHRGTVSRELRGLATMIIGERSSREPPSSGGDSSELGSAPDLTSETWCFITVVVIAAIIGVVFQSRAAASPSN